MICLTHAQVFYIIIGNVCLLSGFAIWMASRNINNGFHMLAVGIEQGRREALRGETESEDAEN